MTKPQSRSDAQNPLLSDWTGPFGLPPLPAIKPEHFRPAFDRALGRAKERIRRGNEQPKKIERLAIKNAGQVSFLKISEIGLDRSR